MPASDAATASLRRDSEAGKPAEGRAGRWLRPAEAARLLGVSERTVRRRVASGQYPVERNGRDARIQIPAELLEGVAGDPADGPRDLTMQALVVAVDALKDALAAERARTQRFEARLEELEDERTRLLAQLRRPTTVRSTTDGGAAATSAAEAPSAPVAVKPPA